MHCSVPYTQTLLLENDLICSVVWIYKEILDIIQQISLYLFVSWIQRNLIVYLRTMKNCNTGTYHEIMMWKCLETHTEQSKKLGIYYLRYLGHKIYFLLTLMWLNTVLRVRKRAMNVCWVNKYRKLILTHMLISLAFYVFKQHVTGTKLRNS